MGYFDDKENFKVVPFTEILASQLNDLIDALFNSFNLAEADAILAKEWAIGKQITPGVFDENTEVDGVDFAAKYHSTQAETSATKSKDWAEADVGAAPEGALTASAKSWAEGTDPISGSKSSKQHADDSSASAAVAVAAEASALSSAGALVYDVGTAYVHPESVIFTDGQTYRVIFGATPPAGTDPSTSTDFVRLTGAVQGEKLLINAEFIVNQENYFGAALTNGAYGHDMWRVGANGQFAYTKESNGDITLNNVFDITPVDVELYQENDKIKDTTGKTLTLSFFVVSLTNSIKVSGSGTLDFRFNSLNLEEGPSRSVWTPANERLNELECYWYFEKIQGPPGVVEHVVANSQSQRVTIPCAPKKQAGSVSFPGGGTLIDITDTGYSINGTSGSYYYMGGGMLSVEVTLSSGSPTTFGVVVIIPTAGETIEIDNRY